ncbi:Zinc finger (C3HC4-type RING finger) family protein [Euphorbia peplus]|nr:Zinc finger (C3HC4-type RING finger) family protein [Euphorbia peplus]
MAHDIQLPCDGDGVCMRCKMFPPAEETLTCSTCVTPWHVSCLSSAPETLASTLQWECPDCSGDAADASAVAPPVAGGGSELLAAIREIEADQTLTDREKAKKRQELMSGKSDGDGEDVKMKGKDGGSDVFDVLDESFKCSFCMQLPERPVTTPCGHNFCLKCFQKWVGQRKNTCAKCRSTIPPKMASNPRINASLVAAIRMARLSKTNFSGRVPNVYHYEQNQNRPDKAYTTDRAKKTGKANACSGKIFVTIPPDHFGPIPAENDPERNQGVMVGESWEDRLECRQWGAHFPHVAGIAGQSGYGAQSVALSGGYVDDEDHGEWFLYTGSGGRDLSGNKRTNKEQSFDQKFEKMNEALRMSCRKGYPVRVVRSHKEKRSSYAPEGGVRYDGCYRIEKCWRKVGIQGHKVCRYLFVRCDNEPAPWTSDVQGDRPRPLPVIKELENATDVTERRDAASWDFDEQDACWKWMIPPPLSRKPVDTGKPEDRKRSRTAIRKAQNMNVRQKLLKEFSCQICQKVMNEPVTTPCAHNFCKSCLEAAFTGKSAIRERSRGGRSLRAQKNVLQCPRCPTDISDFIQDPKVNREVMAVIENLQRQEENAEAADSGEEEEADGSEENPCADDMETGENVSEKAAADMETGENISEKAAGTEAPSVAAKPKRAYKKKKVETGSSSEKTDEKIEDGNGNAENPSAADMETGQNISEKAAGTEAPSVAAKPKRAYKKKKVETGGCSEKTDEKTEDGNGNAEKPEAEAAVTVKKTHSTIVQQTTVVDGNDSPSSPLNVRSSDDDFE